MKRKILFNCSTNVVGGGVKNSTLFILATINDSTFEWIYAISPQIKNLLEEKGASLDERFHLFNDSPASNSVSRKRLVQLSIESKCSLVYTMAGPAYVKFPIRHIQGLSNPYLTHADHDAFALKGSLISIARYYLRSFVQFLYSRNADFFVFQTEQARDSYVGRRGTKLENTRIISNAFDENMKTEFSKHLNQKEKSGELPKVIFCPGANYLHKGFQFIPAIAKEMKNLGQERVIFKLTLKDDELYKNLMNQAKELGVSDWIENFGPYSYHQVAKLYMESDVVYVPSLLETFSASYLEAMVALKPLLVADKGFAREVCGEYSSYSNPKDASVSANKLIELLKKDSGSKQIANSILNRFGNQNDRYNKIMTLIEENLYD